MKIFKNPKNLLLLGCFFWGMGPSATKIITGELPVFYYMSFRFLIGALVLSLFFWKSFKGITLKTVLISSIPALFLFLAFLVETYGLRYTTPVKSGFYISLEFVFIPVIAYLGFKDKIEFKDIGNIALCFIGVLCMNFNGSLVELNLGDFLSIGASIFYAMLVVAVEKLVKTYDAKLITILQQLFVGVFALFIAVPFEKPIIGVSTSTILALLVTGVFCSALAYLILAECQKTLSSSKVGIVLTSIPIFGAIVSWLIFRIGLSPFGYVGAAIIIFGLLNNYIGKGFFIALLRVKKLLIKAS